MIVAGTEAHLGFPFLRSMVDSYVARSRALRAIQISKTRLRSDEDGMLEASEASGAISGLVLSGLE